MPICPERNAGEILSEKIDCARKKGRGGNQQGVLRGGETGEQVHEHVNDIRKKLLRGTQYQEGRKFGPGGCQKS